MISIRIALYLILRWHFGAVQCVEDAKTGVCIKRSHIKEYPVLGGTYPDLIRENSIFVDKSLLLKEIAETDKKIILITCPRKWGKSINMQMMKMFFDVSVDEDGKKVPPEETVKYKFFTAGNVSFDSLSSFNKRYVFDHRLDVQAYQNPPLISQHEDFVKNYLGHYPSIYFDWSVIYWNVGDYESFFTAVKNAICDLFHEHKYLMDVLLEASKSGRLNIQAREIVISDLHMFRKILNIRSDGLISEPELENSFKFLSKLMYEYYGNPVFVFMDEWANPMVDLFYHFSKHDGRNKIVKFFAYFTRQTMKENEYLKKAVLTGILSVGEDELFDDFGDIIARHNVLNNDLHEFYGVTPGEVRSLFKYYEIPDKLVKATMESYEGYQQKRDCNVTVCNIWSLVEFLNKKEYVNYWVDTGDTEAFKHWLKIDKFKQVWKSLIDGGCVAIEYMDMKLDYKGYLHDVNAIWGKNQPTDDKAMNFVFSYLFNTGYLTISNAPLPNDTSKDPRNVNLRAPNNEVKKYMKGLLFPEKTVASSAEFFS